MQLRSDSGKLITSMRRVDYEQVQRDREELMFQGMQQADSLGARGPMRMSEIRAVAGEYGRATRGLRVRHGDRKGYVIASLIGNFAEHAREKLAAYPEVHDRRAVTVIAGGGAFIPDSIQAMRRAKKYAREAKN